MGKKGSMYKVDWQGYSMKDCTRQPQENLKFFKNLVIAYEQSQPKQNLMSSLSILELNTDASIMEHLDEQNAATYEEEQNMGTGCEQEESQQEKLENEEMEEFNNTLKDGETNYEEHMEMIPRDKNWFMIVQRVNKPSCGSQTVSVAKNYYLCEMR